MQTNAFCAGLGAAVLCLAITLPSSATVLFNADYRVMLNTGDTGVGESDVVHVNAFYDPGRATLLNETDRHVAYAFAAGAAGLSFTVDGQVWQVTGPVTVNTELVPSAVDGLDNVVVQFVADTRPQLQLGPDALTTTLSTPWDANVNGIGFLLYLPLFALREGLDPELLAARLYDEADFSSLLTMVSQPVIGAAFSDTVTGPRFFNFGTPASQIPEPKLPALLFLAGLFIAALWHFSGHFSGYFRGYFHGYSRGRPWG
jgi:hypothetical protein